MRWRCRLGVRRRYGDCSRRRRCQSRFGRPRHGLRVFCRGGRAGGGAAALGFTCLGWAAGSESLYDPYNPTAAMLPCLACLFLAWCAVDLDSTALLWLIVVSSFVVQLNNSYLLFLTPLVVAVSCIYVVRSRTGKSRRICAR